VSRVILAALAGVALVAAPNARAQSIPDLNAPKRAAQRAVAAADAQLSAQTGQAVPTRTPAPAPPAPGPASRAAGRPATATPAAATPAASMKILPQVTREIFTYDEAGRRDPFFSLILTEDLRPLLSDLRLVGILYDATQRRSVAIFRDVLTNVQYRVGAGMGLGRMRVAQIKPKAVIFTIDEFGLSRQDSLVMTDSIKVRIR
jgi:hypothetical protein